MAEAEMKRHPLAIAWDEWLASREGQEAGNADTLARYTNRYLENRLKRAFDAGAKAATISPSDFEQLIRLRKVASDADEALQLIQGFDFQLDSSAHGQEIKRRAIEAIAALREVLTHTGEQS